MEDINQKTPAPFPIRTHDYATWNGNYIGLLDVDHENNRVLVDDSGDDELYWIDPMEHLKQHFRLLFSANGDGLWWRCRATDSRDVLTENGMERHVVRDYWVRSPAKGGLTDTFALAWDTFSSPPAIRSPENMQMVRFREPENPADVLRQPEDIEHTEELAEWCEDSAELTEMVQFDMPSKIADGHEKRVADIREAYENRDAILKQWMSTEVSDVLAKRKVNPKEYLRAFFSASVEESREKDISELW